MTDLCPSCTTAYNVLTHCKGTKWGQGGSNSAANGARDVISIVAATNGQKSVTVDIGGNAQTFTTQGDHPLSYFEMPFNDRQGPVTIKLNGKAKTGPAIQNSCPSCGHVSRTPCVSWLVEGLLTLCR